MENLPSYESIIRGEAGGQKLDVALARTEASEGTTMIALTTKYAVMEIKGKIPGMTFILLHTFDPKANLIRIDNSLITALGLTPEQFYHLFPQLDGLEWLDMRDIPIVVEASVSAKGKGPKVCPHCGKAID